MTEPTPTAPGQLMILTGVDAAHEDDFNRWYDREHMAERVHIPGFVSARRFHAADGGPRPYLALYDTESLAVFRSEPYRRAFANQTPWSLRNFERMRDTQRRVGEIAIDLGAGEAAALALFVLPAPLPALPPLWAPFAAALQRLHVLRATLLRTEVALSAPLAAGAPPAAADAVVMVEATQPAAAYAAAVQLAAALGVAAAEVQRFHALWRLGAPAAARLR